MVKHKSQPKKPKKGGVDFKKYKRKLGRKLPPPKNATNTEIKSKAIVLPEQSIVSQKEGLALSRKGLTLKELLQHTNHNNAKVRKDALLGIKEILLKHPAELELHKIAIIEKLRERIRDDNHIVREELYKLFEFIFPKCAKELSGQLVSLLMVYIFNAMTHQASAVRLTAFNFLDLVGHFFPFPFSAYAKPIFRNYGDALLKNQLLEDRNRMLTGLLQFLKRLPCNESDTSADENHLYHENHTYACESEVSNDTNGPTDVGGLLKDFLPTLVRCFEIIHNGSQIDEQSFKCMHLVLQCIDLTVSYLVADAYVGEQYQEFSNHLEPDVVAPDLLLFSMLKKLWEVFPLNVFHWRSVEDDSIFMLNTVIIKIFLQFRNWDNFPSGLVGKLFEFIKIELATKIESGNMLQKKSVIPLIPYIPKLTIQKSFDSRCCIFQALTNAFRNSSSLSSLRLACISAITEMLAPERWESSPDSIDLEVRNWLQNLPLLLVSLDGEDPLYFKEVLRLQLHSLQAASVFSLAADRMGDNFSRFFSFESDKGTCYGPFTSLPVDVQELAVYCLYYVSPIDPILLKSLMSCCLYNEIQVHVVLLILQVLQSAFKVGHMEVGDYLSFLITLLSQFHVPSGDSSDAASKLVAFKCITSDVCAHLPVVGDNNLLFKMLEKSIVHQICSKIPVHNKCALLRLVVALDSKPTALSAQSIHMISCSLPQYLIDVISEFGEGYTESVPSTLNVKIKQYYLLPCFHLFAGSKILLNHVLNALSSGHHFHPQVEYSAILRRILSLLLYMCKDARMLKILVSSSHKSVLESLLQNLQSFLVSRSSKIFFGERVNIESDFNQLRSIINSAVEQNLEAK